MKVEYVEHMGSDVSVVNAARVSFSKAVKELTEKDERLLGYLVRHQHWSPFAHAIVKFRFKAPIFIARQLTKHQVGGSWNEVSRRYVDLEPEFYIPAVWRKKAEDKKQGSSDEPFEGYFYTEKDDGVDTPIETVVEDFYDTALYLYNNMISKGVCPEQARMVLPQSMMTEWIWTGSLAFWARVYKLRTHETAQRECWPLMSELNDHMQRLFPKTWEALINYA